jgi:hypothetical protein
MFAGLMRVGKSDDVGRGTFADYHYNLRPKKDDTVIRLADCDPNQEELRRTLDTGAGEMWAMISRRSVDDERTDAPMPVRLFASGRVSGVVGIVPRGLEAPVDDALGRLAEAGRPPRIPAKIVTTRGGLRVDLGIGTTR